jgi:hypothetical protein
MSEEKCPFAIEDCDGNRSWIESRPEILCSHTIRQRDQRERIVMTGCGRGLCVRRMRSRRGE